MSLTAENKWLQRLFDLIVVRRFFYVNNRRFRFLPNIICYFLNDHNIDLYEIVLVSVRHTLNVLLFNQKHALCFYWHLNHCVDRFLSRIFYENILEKHQIHWRSPMTTDIYIKTIKPESPAIIFSLIIFKRTGTVGQWIHNFWVPHDKQKRKL